VGAGVGPSATAVSVVDGVSDGDGDEAAVTGVGEADCTATAGADVVGFVEAVPAVATEEPPAPAFGDVVCVCTTAAGLAGGGVWSAFSTA
jgi:hypothetical protein